MTALSACLIVRDEAAVIDACLQSLQGVADEIVVVDTGSVDETPERAERYPVELHAFPWCDDFSAARNFALDQATGDWILYIDADERAEIDDKPRFRALLDDSQTLAATVRLHPKTGYTGYAELRLFRRDPGIRFKGVIHERVHDSVHALVKAGRGCVVSSDLTIRHVGYDQSQCHKHPRNLPLLEAYLAQDPARIYCWWHLGDTHRQLGNKDEACRAWRTGIDILRRRGTVARKEESLIYASLIQLLHEEGQPVDDLLAEARKAYPDQLQLQWIEAKIALEAGDYRAARPVFERLSAIDAEAFFDPLVAYDKSLFGCWSLEALALCDFRAGRFQAAAERYRAALADGPDRPSLPVMARLSEALARKRG